MSLFKVMDKVRDLAVVALVPLTFIVVTPWNNLDGTNPIKFLILVSLGSFAFALALIRFIEMFLLKRIDAFQATAFSSIFFILLSFSINRYSQDERLFGISGRSLGVITFVILFLVLVTASIFNQRNIKFLSASLVVSFGVVSIYFGLQLAGIDPATWEDPYGGIPSSTLGNPNFVSSSLAMLSIPLLALFLHRTRLHLILRFLTLPLIVTNFYLIRNTQSAQGLIIFTILLLGSLMIFLNEKFSNRLDKLVKGLTVVATTSILVATLLIALGLQIPGVGSTVSARSDYFRAAWRGISDNPIFGIGFDSFGDSYLRYRDQVAVDRSSGLITDSTHNLFLELGVFGGLPLLVAYLILQALTLRSALVVLTSNENIATKAIVVSWIGFLLQSALSPSSLALLTLGFVLTGVVYGAGKELALSSSFGKRQEPSKTTKKPWGIGTGLVTSTLALALVVGGAYLGSTQLIKDARFRDAIEQGDGAKMISVSRQWPFVYQISRQTAMILKSNGYEELAMDQVRELVRRNPKNIRGWRMLFDYSTVTTERAMALSKIRELDPLNPELAKLTP